MIGLIADIKDDGKVTLDDVSLYEIIAALTNIEREHAGKGDRLFARQIRAAINALEDMGRVIRRLE